MMENLLFIAPTAPLFDKQSGDLRFFTVLNILSKTYKITYLARWAMEDPLENERYISCLRDLGIKVYVGSYLSDILHRNVFKAAFIEFYYIAEHYIPRIRLLQPSCPVIVDTVDVHYLRLHRKYKINKNIEDLRVAEETKTKELAIYSLADIVLTVTEEDGRSLQNDNPNITVRILPNIHPLVYSNCVPNRNEIVFVGGFVHDPNVDAVIYFCKDIFPRIRNVIPEARFTIVGSNPPVQITTLGNNFIRVTGFVPSTTTYLQNSYVSVAPLRYGAGMKGKIGEAMAHGLPVVTTSVGAEGMGLINRENVMIADSPENFANAVIELMIDKGLYRKIQNNSFEYISKNYTPEIVAEKLERILDELDDFQLKKWSLSRKIYYLMNYTFDIAKEKLTHQYK
jgi:glycosyltransferase involved in cell wall biosynthesis